MTTTTIVEVMLFRMMQYRVTSLALNWLFRLAVDMKFPIHIHIHIHRFSVDIYGYIHSMA